jgi:hypothetical protein
MTSADARAEDSKDSKQEKQERAQGVCALVLKLGDWTEKITLPAYQVADEPTLDLSSSKTFMRVQTQPDGTEVKREGMAPPQLRPYNIRLNYEQDDKTGWPGHEEVEVSLTLFERKNKTRVEGPFKANVIRKIVEPRETTEDMPFVSGYARLSNGEKLEFRFGCSKALGT